MQWNPFFILKPYIVVYINGQNGVSETMRKNWALYFTTEEYIRIAGDHLIFQNILAAWKEEISPQIKMTIFSIYLTSY
jgi:hypothetical protein